MLFNPKIDFQHEQELKSLADMICDDLDKLLLFEDIEPTPKN